MAEKTIPELNPTTTFTDQTLFVIDSGTETFRVNMQNLATYIREQIIPVGMMAFHTGSTAPAGWIWADGSNISRTTYSRLFAVYNAASLPYGAGDGSTTFGIPDMRGRVGVGRDNMGGTAANRITNAVSGIVGTTLGSVGGSENAGGTIGGSQSIAHTHNIAHAHQWGFFQANSGGQKYLRVLNTLNDASTSISTSVTNQLFSAYNTPWVTQGSGSLSPPEMHDPLFSGQNRSLYTTGVLSPPGGSAGENAISGPMSANSTVSGSNFSWTPTGSRNVQPSLITNYIIKT
jgi:microcystin-dependent protein